MSIIKVTVDDQALYITESPVVAAQGVNENYFQFTLSEDWTGFGTVALFWKEGNETDVYESVVDGTGKALVPHEVTDSQGRICVGLAGTNGNIVHTSEILKYKVVKGRYTAGQSSEPPTPGIYEQMLSLAGQMSDQFRQVVEEQSEVIEDLQADQAALRSELTAQQTTFQNTVSGQMASFIASQSGDYGATVLWDMDTEGDHNGALAQDTVLTLRENIENFDYLEIWGFNTDVDDSVFIPVERLSGVGTAVKSVNIGMGTTKLRIVETRLMGQFNELTIAHQFIFTFDTTHTATRITQDNKSTYVSQFGISRVIGRKMVQNAELVDIRVGENGTTYQTAGAAVRGQFAAVKAQIPLIDASLATTGNAADAKATGDALTAVNGRLHEQENEFTSKVASRFGAEYSPNLVESDESMTEGYLSKDGVHHAGTSYKYTDYIPVKPGDVVRVYDIKQGVFQSRMARFVACYNENKTVVSSAGSNTAVSAFTVPDGIAYVRLTLDGISSDVSNFMASVNIVCTEYVQYTPLTAQITDNFLTPESKAFLAGLMTNGISSQNIKNKYGNALPKTKIYQTLGLPQTWYYKSAITPENTKASLSAGSAYVSKTDKSVTFLNTTALSSSNGFIWRQYDMFLCEIAKYTGNSGLGGGRYFVAENLNDCSLLCIGDSTVDHDTMTATILSHFAEKGTTVTLLGTLGDGSGTNKNEGRAGWKATDYLTNRQYNGVVNPFYNPTTETFDFAYYMQNQSYSGVDFVVLQLGINDLYNYDETAIEPTWTAMETIIDSILAYNSGIKIILNLPTTPNSDQSFLGVTEFLYRNRVIRYNEYAQAHALSKYGMTKVRCSYCHLILDPDTEIRDNVHPTVAGYQKMALEVVNQINAWQAGV